MKGNFASSLAAVLMHEGGYVNDPAHLREVIEAALARESSEYAARPIKTANHRDYECAVLGCDRRAYASGHCNAHYIRARLGRDLSAPIKNRKRGGQLCIECGEHTGAKGGWHRCTRHFKAHRKRVIKRAAVDAFGDHCSVCKGTFPLPVYDFHHVGQKTDSPSLILMNGSVEKMATELSRCILLCANCHRLEHSDAR